HPYNPKYIGSCLKWNRFWDFGNAQLGDMASHLIDLPYWALNLRFPTSCEAKGEPSHSDGCPQKITATWEHPAAGDRPAVEVSWYDGGYMPGLPSKIFDRANLASKGILFAGDKGWLLADYGMRVLMMKGDMTHFNAPVADELIPASPGQHREWINACKTGSPTLCNFDYSGALIEHNLLGHVAFRVGKKIEWDAKNLRATNCPEADPFIRKTYRKGWELNG
ncbi:MAG: gfo/Idh/MocA family oxidoreductase, partial [Verrucomicrobia bacterium]|nr:gfo/Idh/MocA family oxidoreductase [Verrucomicrobiota bacterium]